MGEVGLLEATLAGVFLETLFFALSIVSFVVSIYVLARKRRRSPRGATSLYNSILFVTTVLIFSLGAVVRLNELFIPSLSPDTHCAALGARYSTCLRRLRIPRPGRGTPLR